MTRSRVTPRSFVPSLEWILLVCPWGGSARAQGPISATPFDVVPAATTFVGPEIALLGVVRIDSGVPQDDSLRIVDGNLLLESPLEVGLRISNSGLMNTPVFSLGRLVEAGDGSPEFRVIYSDDVTFERSVFEFDNKGIVASVKQEVGSHFEGFLEGAAEPLFRLNSFPSMQLELGPGGSTAPDVALRRVGPNAIAILTDGQERIHVDDQGQVGVGTSTPTAPLEMASGAHVTVGGVWMNASSRELKDHVRELDGRAALQAVSLLQPVVFSYRAEPEEEYIGFVAEDVPEMVSHAGRDSLSPMDLVALLTKVVQEQQAEIQELKRDIREIKANLEDSKMSEPDFSKLSRPRHPMPDFVEQALVDTGLLAAYRSRPPYQQNDYLSWISRAKRTATREKRLAQMLYELEKGDLYMKMEYPSNSAG